MAQTLSTERLSLHQLWDWIYCVKQSARVWANNHKRARPFCYACNKWRFCEGREPPLTRGPVTHKLGQTRADMHAGTHTAQRVTRVKKQKMMINN